jgi:hypothetical protein
LGVYYGCMNLNIQTVVSLVTLTGTILTVGIAFGSIRNSIVQINKVLDFEIKPDIREIKNLLVNHEVRIRTLETCQDTTTDMIKSLEFKIKQS